MTRPGGSLGCGGFLTRRVIVALAIVLVLGAGRAARGADAAEAEALIRQGIELRQQGHDERALPLFQKAYDLVVTPRTAGQLGLAEMAVGYWLDAEQHLSLALESPDHPWVAKNLAAIKAALAQVRTNIGEIVVDGAPAGATLTVNHRAAGTFPFPGPVRVPKGTVDIEVAASGYRTMTRSLHVSGSERQQVTVSLEKAALEDAATAKAPPSTAPATLAAGEPALAPQPQPETPQLSPAAAPQAGGGMSLGRKVGWGLGIGGAAVLVGAVVETVLWQQRRTRFNDPANSCLENRPNRGTGAGCSSLYDSLQSAMTLSLIGYIAAGALAGGSAALLLSTKSPEAGGSPVAAACAPGFGTALVTCRLTF
jgi:hypothetical protein